MASVVALLLVAGLSWASPVNALSPITPDNSPRPIAGSSNGAIPPALLRAVSPACIIYWAAAPSFEAMVAAARADGVELVPEGCYRDLAGQQALRDYWCSLGQCNMAATPGYSNHGWAKAADLADQAGEITFDSPGYAWLQANAARFGWNHPFWAEPGGSAPEPWHWEWLGDGGTKFAPMNFGETGPTFGGVPADGNPVGSLDAITLAAPARVSLWGWAIDPDSDAPVTVHAYIDGVFAAALDASTFRADVVGALPGYPGAHGLASPLPVPTGAHVICVYAINIDRGDANSTLGCQGVDVPANPVGSLDEATVLTGSSGATVHVRGWAIDPDSTSSTTVHLYIDDVRSQVLDATVVRNDVGAVFPSFGPNHGFDAVVAVPPGSQRLCAYAINLGPGDANSTLGCASL